MSPPPIQMAGWKQRWASYNSANGLSPRLTSAATRNHGVEAEGYTPKQGGSHSPHQPHKCGGKVRVVINNT
ncbi:hypothetical protein EfsSVR2085_36110 (plasmid) [Enterococcus faecalis]|nr:hypothetical protein EfsSVR2085_36110 [Enterococcus faecalis]